MTAFGKKRTRLAIPTDLGRERIRCVSLCGRRVLRRRRVSLPFTYPPVEPTATGPPNLRTDGGYRERTTETFGPHGR
jgi:hypothetical protein